MASADQSMSPPIDAEGAMSAGEFVLKKLFAEFVALSERKLQNIVTQRLVRHHKNLSINYSGRQKCQGSILAWLRCRDGHTAKIITLCVVGSV